MNKECAYCGALYFPGEKFKCCSLGKVLALIITNHSIGVPGAPPHATHSRRPASRRDRQVPQIPSQRRQLQQRVLHGLTSLHPRRRAGKRYSKRELVNSHRIACSKSSRHHLASPINDLSGRQAATEIRQLLRLHCQGRALAPHGQ